MLQKLIDNNDKIEDGIQNFRNGQALSKYDDDMRRLSKELAATFKQIDDPSQFDELMYGFIYKYFDENDNNPHFFAKRLLEPYFSNESDLEWLMEAYERRRKQQEFDQCLDDNTKVEIYFLEWAAEYHKEHPEALFFEKVLEYKEQHDIGILYGEALKDFSFTETASQPK